MPRVSRQQADHHRAAIEEASARLFREHGIAGVSVAELMAAAGLTHGGFYGHFKSKEVLAARACERAFEHAASRWQAKADGSADAASARTAIIDRYLSVASRDAAGTACPLPALAGDVARAEPDAPVRASYHAGLERLAAVLSGLSAGADAASRRRAALADLALLTGALLLARATAGQDCSGEILDAARQRLANPSREA